MIVLPIPLNNPPDCWVCCGGTLVCCCCGGGGGFVVVVELLGGGDLELPLEPPLGIISIKLKILYFLIRNVMNKYDFSNNKIILKKI
jgi:hypothetical protein